jgi:hypothetical protein
MTTPAPSDIDTLVARVLEDRAADNASLDLKLSATDAATLYPTKTYVSATYAAVTVVGGSTQAAINAAVALLPTDGGHLHFPARTYDVTAGMCFTAYTNLTITADKGANLLANASMADVLHNSFPNYGSESILRFMSCAGVTIRGLSIDGNLANRTPLVGGESYNCNILLSACTDVLIEHNTLIGAMTDNILIMTDETYALVNHNVRILNNEIKEARRNNISPCSYDGLWITGNRIYDVGAVKAIAPMSNVQAESDYAGHQKNLFVTDNDIYGAVGAYSMSVSGMGAENVLIEGNTIRDNTGTGLAVASLLATPLNTGVRVRGNVLRGNGQAGMMTTRKNVELIEGNLFDGNMYGLNSISLGEGTVRGNVFSNNNHEGAVFATFVDITVSGNRFENNASAAGALDSANRAVYATPLDATSIFTFDNNRLSNTVGATPLMKGAIVSAACVSRGSGNVGKNLLDNAALLTRITGLGNVSLDDTAAGDRGDANIAVTVGIDHEQVLYDTPLSTTRYLNFVAAGAYEGAEFYVKRTAAASGASGLSCEGVAALKVLALGTWARFVFLGGAWTLSAYGAL